MLIVCISNQNLEDTLLEFSSLLNYFNYQLIELMEVADVDKQQAVIYLTILAVLEVLLIIFTIASSQQSLITFNLLRILLLVGAHCLKNIAWAAYYTAFALITALYVFDPVGLWITGHGQLHTSTENAFALVLFLGSGTAVVIGYLYKKALEQEVEEDFMGDANPVGYSNPNEANQRNQYLYRAAQNPSAPQPQSKRFQQFSGEAYSLS